MSFPVLAQFTNATWEGSMEPTKSFVENRSQFDDRINPGDAEILYGYDGNGTQIYFTNKGVIYSFTKLEPKQKSQQEEIHELEAMAGMTAIEHLEWERKERQGIRITDMVAMEWENANPNAEVIGIEKTEDYHSYSVKGKNINNLKAYRKILYKNIYAGVDLEYVFEARGLKYSFIVHPGADLSQISMKYPESRDLNIDERGRLHISTLFGDIIEYAPVTFHEGDWKLIDSRFNIDGAKVAFEIGNYDVSKTLIIDPWVDTPILANSNGVWECEKDQSGNVYIIGGEMPMRLRKYNSTGNLQWTYNTPWDTANYWLGTMATDNAGNTYVTAGSAARIQKINTSGGMTWSANGGGLDEYWNIAFNCDQTKLVVGGTRLGPLPPAGSNGMIFEINTNNGSVIDSRAVGSTRTTTIFGIPVTDIEEVRSISSSKNARYYFLTLDTIGAIDEDLGACPSERTIFEEDHTYHWAYKSEFYRPNNGNSGIMAVRANGDFVYTQNGTTLHKRSLADGSILATVSIPGGLNTTTQNLNQPGNSGIDLDDCGNVYVGSGNAVVKYDANLNQLSLTSLPYAVFDVAVSYNGEVVVCGATGNSDSQSRTGYVQVIDMSACAPNTLVCCNANICPVEDMCVDDNPVTISTSATPGTWSGPGVNPSGLFNPATAGVGTHTIVNTLGCGSDSVQITVSPCAMLEVCIENNGDLTVTGGTGPYTWEHDTTYLDCSACPFGQCIPPICSGTNVTEWQEYATGVTATPHPNLPIMVSDNAGGTLIISSLGSLASCTGCAITAQITEQSPVSCFGGSDGAATVTAQNGNGNITYAWGTNPVQTGTTATGLSAGTYTVTVTDANQCSGTTTVTIVGPSSAVSATLTPINPGCTTQGSVSVSASGGTSGYTYLWSEGAQTGTSISNLSAGTYTVTVSDQNACTVVESVTLTSTGSQPSAGIVEQQNVACNGGADGWVSINVSNGTPNYDIVWNTTPSQTGALANNLPAGTYTANVEDANGCETSIQVTITEPTELELITNSSNSQCGSPTGSASVTANGGASGYTYLWDNTQTTSTISNVNAGTYTVTVTDANNCTAAANVAVSDANAPSISLSSSGDPSCPGDSDGTATVSGSGGTGNLTYTWNTTPVQTGVTASNLPAGSYTCTVIDNNGCQSGVTVDIEDPDGISATASPDDPGCGDPNGLISVSASGGTGTLTYTWSDNQTGPSATGLEAGTYTCTITDQQGCTFVITETLYQPDPLTANPALTPASCALADGSIALNPEGGSGQYTYTWCNGAGTTSSLNNIAAGSYCVLIDDGNECTLDTTIVLTSNSNLSVDAINNGNNVLVASSNQPGTTYQWYYNGQPIAGATDSVYEPTQSGVYYVIGTTADGCVDQSLYFEISVVDGIEEEILDELHIHPNPATDQLFVIGELRSGKKLAVEIYAATGQLVYAKEYNSLSGNVIIPVYQYSEGMYLVKLAIDNNVRLEKIVIER